MKNKNVPKAFFIGILAFSAASFLYVNSGAMRTHTPLFEQPALAKPLASEDERDERRWSVPEAGVLLRLVQFAGKFLPVKP